MSAIKKFFEKKKAEAKFKLAGPGQKLGDASSAASQDQARIAALNAAQGRAGPSSQRSGLSQQQTQAASAALNRLQQSSSTNEDFEKKRSQAAIRAMAQKELEKERQIQAEASKLKDTYGEKSTIELEGPSMLGCEGVYYKCPEILGPNMALPRSEMQKRIKEYLYEQLNTDDRGLTACLIIHTLNKDTERVKTCVDTLCKYIDNILQNPTEEKFRKIRKSNPAYINRVSGVEGHDLFLSACGFETENIDEQEFWIYPASTIELDPQMSVLYCLRDAIEAAEPIKAELDRGLRILLPSQVSKRVELPPDFFNISPEEIKKEQKARTEAVEQQGMLRTKAMREREEQREKRKYRYTLIRIRFPDGLVLQGTFSVYEKFCTIVEFVTEALEYPLPFVLFDAGKGLIDNEQSNQKTLLDLGLIPSAILTFNWHPDVAEGVESSLSNLQIASNDKAAYIKQDLLQMALEETKRSTE